MASINSGISFYPSGFDLKASGSTMFYVADEVRDPFLGNIISSGDIIVGVNVNTSFTSIDAVQKTLGINPQGTFATVGSRFLNVESGISSISGTNLGFGTPVFNSKNGTVLQFNTVSGAGTVAVSSQGNLVIVSGNALVGISGTSPIFTTGDTISILSGSSSQNGYISSGDWITFNSKQPAGNYITTTGGQTVSGTLNAFVLSGTTISGSNATITSISGTIADFGTIVYSALISGTNISGTTATIATINNATLNGQVGNFNSVNVSGNSVIVSGNNLGTGFSIFSSKLGNNLQFNTVSGIGNITVSSANNVITFSGAGGGGSSNLTSPASTTSSGIAIWSGTSGAGFLDSSITISPNGQLNATTISSNSIIISGNAVIVSGSNLGAGLPVFNNSILGNNLQFNSISGVGSVTTSLASNIIKISGAGLGITTQNKEIPSGLINSVNKVFTLTGTPYNNSLNLFQDGILINASGIGTNTFDYVLSGNTITTLAAPLSGVSLVANYVFLNPSGADITGQYTAIISGIAGPNSTTQNALVLWNNTSGTAVQNSNITYSGVSFIFPSGTNLVASVSGSNNIGSPSAEISNIYSDNYWNNNPSFSYIQSSGSGPGIAAAQALLSGVTFNISISGANFITLATNPHKITYIGPNPIFANCSLSATMVGTTTGGSTTLSIGKNGNIIQNQAVTSSTNSPSMSFNLCAITPLVSGDFIQGFASSSQNFISAYNGWSLSVFKLV